MTVKLLPHLPTSTLAASRQGPDHMCSAPSRHCAQAVSSSTAVVFSAAAALAVVPVLGSRHRGVLGNISGFVDAALLESVDKSVGAVPRYRWQAVVVIVEIIRIIIVVFMTARHGCRETGPATSSLDFPFQAWIGEWCTKFETIKGL